MRLRLLTAKILLVAVLPVVFLGLIDPLEGGIALLAAAAIYLVAFLLLGEWPKRLLWIPFLSSVVIGGVTLLIAVTRIGQVSGFPMNPFLMVGLWAYRVAVLVTLIAALWTAVKAFFPNFAKGKKD